MAVFIDQLKKSIDLTVKNWTILPLIALFDLLFFSFLGVNTSIFKAFTATALSTFSQQLTVLGMDITSAALNNKSTFDILLADPIIMTSTKTIIGFGLMFTILLYITWILFQGMGWKLSYKTAGIKNKDFFKNFSLTSLMWFVVGVIILMSILKFILFALLRPVPIIPVEIMNNITSAIFFVFFYFFLVSLSSIPTNFKKTFKLGIMESPNILAALAIVVLVLFLNFQVTLFLLKSIFKTATVTTLTGIMIVLIRFIIAAPFLAWARVYLILISRNLHQ